MFHSDMNRAKAAAEWDFGGVDYMNHGSFGACPRKVKEFLTEQRRMFLQNPMDYFMHEGPRCLTENRLFWAEFSGADPEGVVHVECATQGVNSAANSWRAPVKFFFFNRYK